MSDHILLNLLNELRKRDQTRGLSSILSFFFATNNARARMTDSIYRMTLKGTATLTIIKIYIKYLNKP